MTHISSPVQRISFLYLLGFSLLSAPIQAQTAPDFPGARILLEARDAAADRATHISTCHTAECRAEISENSLAAESFCDTPAPQVAGAEGSCPAPATVSGEAPPELGDHAALGCARKVFDRVPGQTWQMDDPQKLCVWRSCAGGQPCFVGHAADGGDLWTQGATLELPASDPVRLADGSDFHLWTVIRYSPSAESGCLAGTALRHLCIEPDGSLYLRLDSWSADLTPPGAVPTDAWVSVEISREAGALRVFIDGEERTLGTPWNHDQPLVLGYLMSLFKGGYAFTGRMAGMWLYERVLDDAERQELHQYLADVYDVGPAAVEPPDPGSQTDPILHWALDETGGTTAADGSGNGRHGTVGTDVIQGLPGVGTNTQGAVRATAPSGNSGNLDDGVWVSDFASDDVYEEATVALWYRLDETSGDGYLFHWGGTYNDPDAISAYVDRGKEMRIRVHDGTDTSSVLSATPVSAHGFFDDSSRHHLVVVKSATGTEVYFDGIWAASHPMGSGPFRPGLGFGLGTNEGGTFGVTADFDEVKVWNRALGTDEITALFEAAGASQDPGPAPEPEPEPEPEPSVGPIVHLPLDETTGHVASDVSGFGNHGQIGYSMLLGSDGVQNLAAHTMGVGGNAGDREEGLEIPLSVSTPLQQLTIALWYRLPEAAHDGYLFHWGGTYRDDHAVSAYLDEGTEIRVRVRHADDHSSVISTTPTGFDDTAWHHLAVVKNESGSTVYFDGVPVAVSASGSGDVLPGLGFGLGINENGRFGIEADFDDLRVYERALGADEIDALYQAGGGS